MIEESYCVWRPSSVLQEIPKHVVCIRNEEPSSYIARIYHEGNLYLGQTRYNSTEVEAIINGIKIESPYYDILCANNPFWSTTADAIRKTDGKPNSRSVIMNRNVRNELFIGRSLSWDTAILGTIQDNIMFPAYSTSVAMDEFEVLQSLQNGTCRQCDEDINSEVKCSRIQVSTDFPITIPANDETVWIDYSLHSISEIPDNAVHAGCTTNGSVINIGRARYRSKIIPVAIIPAEESVFYRSMNLTEEITEFQILVGSRFGWGQCRNGHVPLNAVPSGCIDTPYIYHSIYNENFQSDDQIEVLLDISKYHVKEIKKKKPEISETLTCKICMEKKVEVLISPCNHAILCSKCFESLKNSDRKCPLCRQLFNSGSNIFY